MDSRQLLAKNVKKLRVAKELSQEALAVEAGVERSHLGKIERARLDPTLLIIDRIAKALGVTIAALFDVSTALAKKPDALPKGRKPTRKTRRN
jgi:transcriptional regulator with XRE-family HTH domain